MASTLDLFRLDGQTAFISGASRGLGRVMALALADAGANVAISGRTAASLVSTVAEIEARGVKAWGIEGDMATPEGAEATCGAVLATVGTPDILINNVGNRSLNVPIAEQTTESWRELFDFNLTSVFIATRELGGAMVRRGTGGRIINTASMSGMIINRGIGGRHYESAKAAVVHFTRATAADWAPNGINVNAISPGLMMTETNQRWQRDHPDVIEKLSEGIPLGRPGRPEEIGPLALYLASPASSYVTGANFVIDGGYTIW
jgi:NAD(P)-dependent dehydrogenase (short-subunit alcohol dehydrogenase family)